MGLYLVCLTSKEPTQEGLTNRFFSGVDSNTYEEAVEYVKGLYEKKPIKGASIKKIRVYKKDTSWNSLEEVEPLYTWYPWL